MAEYKEIHGTKIRNYTTNPDNPITGEVWYNETDNVLKFSYPNVTTEGSLATSVNLNAVKMYVAGAGTASNAVVFGGSPAAPAAPQIGDTELWDGSTWTEVNNLNSGRSVLGGAGTYTSALAFGGTIFPSGPNGPVPFTESWNGTNWTEVNDLNAARNSLTG